MAQYEYLLSMWNFSRSLPGPPFVGNFINAKVAFYMHFSCVGCWVKTGLVDNYDCDNALAYNCVCVQDMVVVAARIRCK